MSDKHTPGTIRYEYEPGYCGELIASNGNTIATFNEEPGKANARRLVACWNAFEGVPTEKFEGKTISEYVANESYINGISEGHMGLEGNAAQAFMGALAGFFVGVGAENYFEASFTHPGAGPFRITMQKTTGKTPHECRKHAERQRDELLAHLKIMVNALADSDDEGLIEHAEPMIAARAAIAKAEASK